MSISKERFIEWGKQAMKDEINHIQQLPNQINTSFAQAVDAILGCRSKVIVCGLGKSGWVGRKIAATFSSTGTPSFFLDASEACHGDLGAVEKDDLLLLLSFSGSTPEVRQVIQFAKIQGNTVIAISQNQESNLAQKAAIFLPLEIPQEACPLNLAPTSSTTAMLLLGDALAITLMKARNIQAHDFAKWHPAGNLGWKLNTQVKQVMRKKDLPLVSPNIDFQELIFAMTAARLGLAVIGNLKNIQGIVTDGDLRRAWKKFKNLEDIPVTDYMTENPKTISSTMLLNEAEPLFKKYKIAALLVVDENELQGILQVYDIGLPS